MAKYQKYAEYKDSGVEWLKEIPKNWFLGDLRRGIDFLTDFEANGSFADVKANVDLDSEEKFAWYVRATDLQNQRFGIVDGNRTIDFKAYSFLNKTSLYGGELLVAKRGEIGKVYLMPEIFCKATLAPNLYLIRLNNLLYPKYTFYWFLSLYGKPQLELADKSTTIGALYKDDVKACQMLYPSYMEQTRIASFLDHETAKIDSLIAKQEKLIELLKEKRQAVISHAVTKGLNPDVAMKDSGVEWLGQVPEHWTVTKIGFHTLKIGSGKTPKGGAEIYQDEGVLFIRSQNVYNDGLRIDSSESVYISEAIHDEMATSKVSSGDILLNITGGSIGRSSLVPDDFPEANVNQHVCIIRVREYLREFLASVIQSDLIQAQIRSIQTGGNREGLNFEQISKFSFALPPQVEQKEIIQYIKNKLDEFQKLEDNANKAIQLMQERRTALISSAVTGKINVSNWQHPNEAKTEFSA